MQTHHININSAAYRLSLRPRPLTVEQEIAKIERYLVEMAHASWTGTYKSQVARLAELKEAR